MARAEWTLTAEDELTEIAYWIAVEDERPHTARRIVEEIQQKAENYADTPGKPQAEKDLVASVAVRAVIERDGTGWNPASAISSNQTDRVVEQDAVEDATEPNRPHVPLNIFTFGVESSAERQHGGFEIHERAFHGRLRQCVWNKLR